MQKGLLSQFNQKDNERQVILVRHPETAMNEEGVVRGWSDVPIDDDEYSQIVEVGKGLKEYDIDGIIASDLLRTLQTAQCLSIGSGAPILCISNFLHTWNVGGFEGLPTDKVDEVLEKLASEEPDKTIEDGESFNAFKARFLLGLIAMLNSYPDKTLVFATHGRNLATLNAWAQEGYPNTLDVSSEHLGYEDYEPGSAHLFNIKSDLLV